MKNEGRDKFNNYIFLLDSSVHVNRSFNNLTVDDIKGARPNPKVSMQYSAFILVLDFKNSFNQNKTVQLLRVMKKKLQMNSIDTSLKTNLRMGIFIYNTF